MMLFLRVFLIFSLCFVVACSSPKRAGSFYDRPEFTPLIAADNWQNGDISPALARNIFDARQGSDVLSATDKYRVGHRYYAALGTVCRKFYAIRADQYYTLCTEEDDFDDMFVVRAFQ